MIRFQHLPEYFFFDSHGSVRSIRHYLGDYTVLAFTHSNSLDHINVINMFNNIVVENGNNEHIKVVCIDIHLPSETRNNDGMIHHVNIGENLITINDPEGKIRRWHGVIEEDEIFIIGPDHTIIESLTVKDTSRILHRLRVLIAQYIKRLQQKYQYESCN